MQSSDLLETLKDVFGFASFREGQTLVIDAVLAGDDCVAIMPTGGGKSLCYQLPALAREGVTLVVSPLIALMKDQVDGLEQLGVAATFINSSLSREASQERLRGLAQGRYPLVYVAPERFKSPRFRRALASARVGLVAIDEAHCISMWGHDFRPDYRRLGELLNGELSNGELRPQLLALTATATPEVRDDIVRQLRLGEAPRAEPTIVVRGFARPGLGLHVTRLRRRADKLERALEILAEHKTGIVYCATRKNVELASELLTKEGVRCIAYHGGMGEAWRKRAQERFVAGEVPVAVATNAFGMGIDRADLRAVIHWDVPGSLEAYYQEAGRGGRDGATAHCELLFSFADVRTQDFFIEGANPPPDLILEVYHALCQLCPDGVGWLGERQVLAQLGRRVNNMAVGSAMRVLARQGFIESRTEPGGGSERIAVLSPAPRLGDFDELRAKADSDRSRLRRMLRYVEKRSCRHGAILRYFGDPEAPKSCTACDNCLRNSGQGSDARGQPDEQQWVEIQKVLSAVARLKGRYGKSKVAQMLVGSRDKTVLAVGLDKVPTFGAMKGRSQPWVKALIDALLDEECIASQGEEYPTLALTKRGWKVMRRQEDIELEWPEEDKKKSKKSRKKSEQADHDVALDEQGLQRVEALKALRTELAEARQVPPYVILHDRTLRAIAAACPQSQARLLEVKGIGPAKLADFGQRILDAIQSAGAHTD